MWPEFSSLLTEVKQARFSGYQHRASRAVAVGGMPPNKCFSPNGQRIPSLLGGAPYSIPEICPIQQGCTWHGICEGKCELLKTGIAVGMRAQLLWTCDLSPISYCHRNFTSFLPSPIIPITMSLQTRITQCWAAEAFHNLPVADVGLRAPQETSSWRRDGSQVPCAPLSPSCTG